MTAVNTFELLANAASSLKTNWEDVAAKICPRHSGCPTKQAHRLVSDAAEWGLILKEATASKLLEHLRLAGIAATALRELRTAASIQTRDDASSFPGEEGLRTHADDLARSQREAVAFTHSRLTDDLTAFKAQDPHVVETVALLKEHVPTLEPVRFQEVMRIALVTQAAVLAAGIRQAYQLRK